jgi:hypothetical protein
LSRSAVHISDLAIFTVTIVTTSTFTTKEGRHAPRIFQWVKGKGAGPEAIHNLSLILKTMLQISRHKWNSNITLFG